MKCFSSKLWVACAKLQFPSYPQPLCWNVMLCLCSLVCSHTGVRSVVNPRGKLPSWATYSLLKRRTWRVVPSSPPKNMLWQLGRWEWLALEHYTCLLSMYMNVYSCAHECVEVRGQPRVPILGHHALFVWERVDYWPGPLPSRLGCLVSELLGISPPLPPVSPSLGWHMHTNTHGFVHVFLGSSSDPHSCKASILLTQPCPQLLNSIIFHSRLFVLLSQSGTELQPSEHAFYFPIRCALSNAMVWIWKAP